MKDIILRLGDKFLAVVVTLSYVAILISGISAMGQSFWNGLLALVVGFVLNTLLFFFIYNIIDIRESLREISKR